MHPDEDVGVPEDSQTRLSLLVDKRARRRRGVEGQGGEREEPIRESDLR